MGTRVQVTRTENRLKTATGPGHLSLSPDVGAIIAMDAKSQISMGAHARSMVIAPAILISVSCIWVALTCSIRPYADNLHTFLSLFVRCAWVCILFLALLQLVAMVLLAGKDAAPEIRCRLTVFTIMTVLVLVISIALPATFPPVSDAALGGDQSRQGTWYTISLVLLRGVVPLFIGGAVHSALYLVSDMRHLNPSPRNRLSAYITIAILAVGSSGSVSTVIVCSRIMDQQLDCYRSAFSELWRSTDHATRRFVEESCGDRDFLLLRANFLADAGRSEEASALYGMVFEATDVGHDVRGRIGADLEKRHQPSSAP